MQYKLFSTHVNYLPEMPAIAKLKSHEEAEKLLEESSVNEVTVNKQLALIGGLDEFLDYLKIKKASMNDVVTNPSIKMTLDCLEVVQSHLIDADDKAKAKLLMAMEIQEIEERVNELSVNSEVLTYFNSVTNELVKASNNKYGYIVWIKYSATNNDKLTSQIRSLAETIKPEPFDPTKAIELLASKVSRNKSNNDESDELSSDSEGSRKAGRRVSNGPTTVNCNAKGNNQQSIPPTPQPPSAQPAAAGTNGNPPASSQPKGKQAKEKPEKKVDAKLIEGARLIAAAAKQILERVKNDSSYPALSKQNKEFFYSTACINQAEFDFYFARNSAVKVLQVVANQYASAPPWSLIPPVLENGNISSRAAARQEKRAMELEKSKQIAQLCDSLLVRKNHNLPAGREALVRDGLTTTATSANIRNVAHNPTTVQQQVTINPSIPSPLQSTNISSTSSSSSTATILQKRSHSSSNTTIMPSSKKIINTSKQRALNNNNNNHNNNNNNNSSSSSTDEINTNKGVTKLNDGCNVIECNERCCSLPCEVRIIVH
jgi:hypothetical protein